MPPFLHRTAGGALAAAVLVLPFVPQQDRSTARPTKLSDRLRSMAAKAPLCVGHRGDAATFPENTLPSFASAVQAGAHMVELDFHQASDGVLVCLHDATVDRTTDGEQVLERRNIAVAELRIEDLRKLDAGSWKHERYRGTRLPTLADALVLIQKDSITMIEHKAGEPEKLVELLRRMNLLDDVLVQSFDWQFLERLHRLESRITIGALGEKALTPSKLSALARTGASLVHWQADRLRIEDVKELRRRGYLICVYTVNSDLAYVGAAALGIDLITTDQPARLIELINRGDVARR